MTTLWQRTTFLFWQYPVLWLPLPIADLLGFALRQLQKQASHQVILWLWNHSQHSVLGNVPRPLFEQTHLTAWAATLTAPLAAGAQFVYVCLYAAALVITAAQIKSLLETQGADLRGALTATYRKSTAILWFSLKMMVSFLLFPTIFGPAMWLFTTIRPSQKPPIEIVIAVVSLAVVAAIAYLLAPSAVNLLRSPSCPPLARDSRQMSRIAATIAALASTALGILQQNFAKSVYGTPLKIGIFRFVSSLIIALPYIPLCIALTVIATERGFLQQEVPASDGSDHLTS